MHNNMLTNFKTDDNKDMAKGTKLGYIRAKLGASSETSVSSVLGMIVMAIILLVAIITLNYKALGKATGATGPIVRHGFALTFLQPFYSLFSIYYLIFGEPYVG